MEELNKWSKAVSKDLRTGKKSSKDTSCLENWTKEMLTRRVMQLDARIEAVKLGGGVNFPTLLLSLSMFFASIVTILFNIISSVGSRLNAAQLLHSIWGDQAIDAINRLVSMEDVTASVASNNDMLMTLTVVLFIVATLVLAELVLWLLFDNGVGKKREIETYILARSVCLIRLESMSHDSLSGKDEVTAGDVLTGAEVSTS